MEWWNDGDLGNRLISPLYALFRRSRNGFNAS